MAKRHDGQSSPGDVADDDGDQEVWQEVWNDDMTSWTDIFAAVAVIVEMPYWSYGAESTLKEEMDHDPDHENICDAETGSVGMLEKPIPDPGPNDAIVKTTAALICTSDVHTVDVILGLTDGQGVDSSMKLCPGGAERMKGRLETGRVNPLR